MPHPENTANGPPDERFSRRLHLTALSILFLVLLVNVYGALELRGLYADGAGVVMKVLVRSNFKFAEPSRLTVHFLQQLPTVLAIRAGLKDIQMAAVLYGLTTQLLPLLLVYLCYPILPRERKELFVFPLLHYLAGSMAASYAPIVEGPVATAYFWVLLYMILFRMDHPVARVLTVMLSLPVVFLHEVMSFLAPILTVTAIWRARRAPQKSARTLCWIMSVWFLVVTVMQLGFIAYPRAPHNRDRFVADLFCFRWLVAHYGINVPAVLGLLACLAAIGIWKVNSAPRECTRRLLSRLILAFFGLLCLGGVVGTLLTDWFFTPSMQFTARNYSAFVSLPLVVLAIISAVRSPGRPPWACTSQLIVLAFLASATCGWHMIGIKHWSTFVHGFRESLSSHRGLITWQDALASRPDEEKRVWWKVYWPWTNPTLSFLLSPDGKVTTVIDNPAPVRYRPFDPSNPHNLPQSPFFDTTEYRRALTDPSSARTR